MPRLFFVTLPSVAGAGERGEPIAGMVRDVIIKSSEGYASISFLLAQTYEFVGEWLSLVEHLVRDQGVGGSNPLSPTNLIENKYFASYESWNESLARD